MRVIEEFYDAVKGGMSQETATTEAIIKLTQEWEEYQKEKGTSKEFGEDNEILFASLFENVTKFIEMGATKEEVLDVFKEIADDVTSRLSERLLLALGTL